jgi:hypothetical protein
MRDVQFISCACAIGRKTFQFCIPARGRGWNNGIYGDGERKRFVTFTAVYLSRIHGFETHAGFTKAFKKCYGYPPSPHRLHILATPPARATVESAKTKQGGTNMQIQIKEIKPFAVVGVASRHSLPNVILVFDWKFRPQFAVGQRKRVLLTRVNGKFKCSSV